MHKVCRIYFLKKKVKMKLSKYLRVRAAAFFYRIYTRVSGFEVSAWLEEKKFKIFY